MRRSRYCEKKYSGMKRVPLEYISRRIVLGVGAKSRFELEPFQDWGRRSGSDSGQCSQSLETKQISSQL